MGSAGKRQNRSRLVVNARFEHLWKIFFELALNGKLPNVFDSKNLIGLECSDFSEITQVNIFLQTAHEKGRLENVGDWSPRKFKIFVEPRQWLPEHVRNLVDKNNFGSVIKKLVEYEHDHSTTLTADDFQLAILDLSGEVVNEKQLAILIKIFTEEGLVEKVDERNFKITELAEEKYLNSKKTPQIILTTKDYADENFLEILNKLFPLFWMHRLGQVFEARFSIRFKNLRFKNKKEMMDAFKFLEECNILVKHTRLGNVVKDMWRWNVAEVPLLWQETLRRK